MFVAFGALCAGSEELAGCGFAKEDGQPIP